MLKPLMHAMPEAEPAGPNRLTKADGLWLVALTVAAGLLLLPNLGEQYLWQDEAQTALLGRSVLLYGLPRATDGHNFFLQNTNHIECTENLTYRWQPWLPFYLVAATFAVLGESALTARLPFALFGEPRYRWSTSWRWRCGGAAGPPSWRLPRSLLVRPS